MPVINIVSGCIYVFLGFSVAGMGTYRVYGNWQGWTKAQRTILVGIIFIAYAQLERGIELLAFNAHGPTIASIPAMIGMGMCCYYFFVPTDPRIFHPEPWKEALKKQEPENYDRFLEVLNASAKSRNEQDGHPQKPEYKSE